MPIKFLRENSDILSGKLRDVFNQGIFPNRLKLADTLPMFKAGDSSVKKN